jgi:hypothetical protein
VNPFNQLFDSLSLSESNGLCITKSVRWEGLFSKKVEQTLQVINPYAFFAFNNEPLILFFEESQNKSEVHKLCWNFNVTPIIFFVSDTDIAIYNGFELENANSVNPLLKKIANGEQKKAFSFWNIVSGNTFQEYQNELTTENRVDKKLLSNIKATREQLIKGGLLSTLVNNLIGRLIFVRYLIDRKVQVGFRLSDGRLLDQNSFLTIIESNNELYDLFKYLKTKFKGDLFPITTDEIQSLNSTHLKTLYHLFNGDEIKSGQISLFNIYNFEILPIEFISNIYEYFMGDDKKKTQKAYYTPSFLVNYILDETVSTYFGNQPDKDYCKVIDPTCGSGIFLVEAFRRVVGQYEKIHGKITNGNSYKLKEILTNNIYGIDKDPDAVNVAMFSLYITLLDYQHPKDIEHFEFPTLLNTNFFVQDIFDFYDPTLFNNEIEENYVIKLYSTDFQFIIGNPPWGNLSDSPYLDYIKRRSKKEKTVIKIADKQFAPAFLLRLSDFCSTNTICAVVVNSKILYNQDAHLFRAYYLKNFFIDRVFEMSPIRKDVFNGNDRSSKGAIAPAAVLFYRHAKDGQITNDNEVTHVSVKYNIFYNLLKQLVIEKNDVKKLKQSNFINSDWVWKVLLYGNVLDYYFIKRLKTGYESINSIVSQKDKFAVGVGVKMNIGKKDASHLMGKPYLDLSDKTFSPFKIVPDSTFDKPFVESTRNPALFEAPVLLVKRALDGNFRLTASTYDKYVIFSDNVIAVKPKENLSLPFISCVEAILQSKLSTYYQLNISSSIGIEREKATKEEILSFPYAFSESLSQIAQQIEDKLKAIDGPVNLYNVVENGANLFVSAEQADGIKNLYEALNSEVNELYDVNDVEAALVDYAENITIPLIKNDQKVYQKASHKVGFLKQYAAIFFNHFGKIFNGRNGHYFEIEVRYNRFFVCMIFRVVNQRPQDTIYINADDSLDMSFLSKLAIQEVSKNLYVQKDIRVFNETEFYIIKPNEMKCWHAAIAYSDLFAIREQMMKQSQRESVLA